VWSSAPAGASISDRLTECSSLFAASFRGRPRPHRADGRWRSGGLFRPCATSPGTPAMSYVRTRRAISPSFGWPRRAGLGGRRGVAELLESGHSADGCVAAFEDARRPKAEPAAGERRPRRWNVARACGGQHMAHAIRDGSCSRAHSSLRMDLCTRRKGSARPCPQVDRSWWPARHTTRQRGAAHRCPRSRLRALETSKPVGSPRVQVVFRHRTARE